MPSYKQIRAENARKIATLGEPDLRAIHSVLLEAHKDLNSGLKAWLKKIKPEDREDKYTIHTHRALLLEIDDAMDRVKKKLGPAAFRDLRNETAEATDVGVKQLKKLVEAGQKKFSDSVQPLRIDLAKIVLRTNKMLIHRHENSAKRYAGEAGKIVQRQMAVGLVKGESVNQMMRRLTGKLKTHYDSLGDAEKAAAASDQFLLKTRYQAERLVRTELIHAANVAQTEALDDENDRIEQEGGGDDEKYMKMWDATIDGQTCDDCEELDGEIVAMDDLFSGGVDQPPLHPNCRCSIVPWMDSWGAA